MTFWAIVSAGILARKCSPDTIRGHASLLVRHNRAICVQMTEPATRPIPRTATYRPAAGAREHPNPQAEALAAMLPSSEGTRTRTQPGSRHTHPRTSEHATGLAAPIQLPSTPQIRGQVQAHVRGVAAHGRRGGGGAVDQPVRQPVPHRQHAGTRIPRPGRPKPGQHPHCGLTRRVAASPDPPTVTIQPGGQLQPHIPAPMPPALRQPRARPPILPAGRRIQHPHWRYTHPSPIITNHLASAQSN